jgi:hypothetical protein
MERVPGMKERPILFSAPMVRALLDGRKTQTRRVVKLRGKFADGADVVVHGGRVWKPARVDYSGYVACPYGQPGDRLWVRETFSEFDTHHGKEVWYRAESDDPSYWHNVTWRPSIFMPRRLSRITLELTGVRVVRLKEISAADVLAEGCTITTPAFPKADYLDLWDKINGPGSGVSDSIPTKLPEGSYVVPADVVRAIIQAELVPQLTTAFDEYGRKINRRIKQKVGK